MDDMNQTQEPNAGTTGTTGQEEGQHSDQPRDGGPRVTREQVLDIERLRRSSTNKYVAGVSGGLGRHLDIDPLIVRVVFAVTALFGVGILLYVALWLIVPDDADQVPVRTAPETRKVLVLVAGGLAAAMLAGAVFGDTWGVFPLALLALAGIAIYAAVSNKDAKPAHPAAVDPDHYRREQSEAWTAGTPGGPGTPDQGIGWNYTPPPPRKPRRQGPILFWPTLAVLAIALGSLAIYDIDNPVAQGAYAALAVAIIGIALIIGAFVGRAGGLILLGLLTVPPLLATSIFGNQFQNDGDIVERPTLASEVQDSYEFSAGSFVLDLTRLDASELSKLDGREIDIDMKAGEILVVLPEDRVNHRVEADITVAGEIRIGDRVVNGLDPTMTDNSNSGDASRPTISLDLEGSVGTIEVTHEGDFR